MSSSVIICCVVDLGVDELVVGGGIVELGVGLLVVDGVGFLVVGFGFLVVGLLVVLGFLVVAGLGFFVVLGRLVVVVEGLAVVVAWVALLGGEAGDVAAPSLLVLSTKAEVTFAAVKVADSDEASVTTVVAWVVEVLLGGAEEAVASDEASIITVFACIVVELLGAADCVVATLLLAFMVEVEVAFATVGVVDSEAASSSLTRFLSMISVTGAFVKNMISVVVSETGNEVVLVVVEVVVVVVVLGCFLVVVVGGFFVVAFDFGVGLRVVGGFLVVGRAGAGFLVIAAVTVLLIVVLAAVDDVDPEVLESVSDDGDGGLLEGASVEAKVDGAGLDSATVVFEVVEGLLLVVASDAGVTLVGASVAALNVVAMLECTSELEEEELAGCSVDSRPSGDISVVDGERSISPPVNPARALPMAGDAGDAQVVLSRPSGPSIAIELCAPRERVVPSEVPSRVVSERVCSEVADRVVGVGLLSVIVG